MSVQPKYLQYTDETNALDYLEHACRWLQQTETDETCWKWAIIALHGAVYGFAVSTCRGTNPDNIVKKPTGKNFEYSHMEARILSKISPEEEVRKAAAEEVIRHEKWNAKEDTQHLLGFSTIIKLSQNPAYVPNPLELTGNQKESLSMLHEELRHMFLHFPPASWSIEMHGLPQIAIDTLQVIRFLALESNAYLHVEEQELSRIGELITETTGVLETSELYSEAKLLAGEQ